MMMPRTWLTLLLLCSSVMAAKVPEEIFEHTNARIELEQDESAVVLCLAVNGRPVAMLTPVEHEDTLYGICFTGEPGTYTVAVSKILRLENDILKPVTKYHPLEIKRRNGPAPEPPPGPGPAPGPGPGPAPGPVPAEIDNTYGMGIPIYQKSKLLVDKAGAKTILDTLVKAYTGVHEGRMVPAEARTKLAAACTSAEAASWLNSFDSAMAASIQVHGTGNVAVKSMLREAAEAMEVSLR